jgi:hypothetical protein
LHSGFSTIFKIVQSNWDLIQWKFNQI